MVELYHGSGFYSFFSRPKQPALPWFGHYLQSQLPMDSPPPEATMDSVADDLWETLILCQTSNRVSASPSSSAPWKYDVFLSFRGPDTCKGITSELYHRLQGRGIKTFMDDRDLQAELYSSGFYSLFSRKIIETQECSCDL